MLVFSRVMSVAAVLALSFGVIVISEPAEGSVRASASPNHVITDEGPGWD